MLEMRENTSLEELTFGVVAIVKQAGFRTTALSNTVQSTTERCATVGESAISRQGGAPASFRITARILVGHVSLSIALVRGHKY